MVTTKGFAGDRNSLARGHGVGRGKERIVVFGVDRSRSIDKTGHIMGERERHRAFDIPFFYRHPLLPFRTHLTALTAVGFARLDRGGGGGRHCATVRQNSSLHSEENGGNIF